MAVKYPHGLSRGTQLYQVWTVLSELPGVPMTTRELADETGLTQKHCSAYVRTLIRKELAQSRPSEQRHGQAQEYWVGELL